jgi:ADP-ribose pyrophosphatase
MSDFDPADCLDRYFALVRERPERFTNPDGEIYEILLDPPRMDRARRDAFDRRRSERLPAEDTRVGVLAVDPYLMLMREAVRFADGSYGLYNRLMVPSGTAILPVIADRADRADSADSADSGGSVALLHRFRHGTRRWHIEAPRGSFSGAGTLAEEAQRELVEEIGSMASELIDLGELHSTTGCMDEAHQLYLARISAVGTPDKHEAITSIKVLPIAAVEGLIAKGEITDGPTLALFLRARLRGYL